MPRFPLDAARPLATVHTAPWPLGRPSGGSAAKSSTGAGYTGDTATMSDHAPSDADLLGSFLDQRSEAAFATLVERHGGMVMAVCRRHCGNGADAEDAAQATFLVLARRAASLRGMATLAPWLHTVARHASLKARASSAARRAREQEVARMSDQSVPATASDEASAWSALAPVLDRELAALPERYRAPLILFHLEGRSMVETAQRLGKPVGTIGSALSRGRELLRRRLERITAVSEAGLERGLQRELGLAALPAALAASLPQAAVAVSAGQAATLTGTAMTLADQAQQAVQHAVLVAKLKLAAAGVAGVIAACAAGSIASQVLTPLPSAPPPGVPAPAPLAAAAVDPAGIASADWRIRLATVRSLALQGGTAITAEQAAALAQDDAWPVREAFIGAIPDLVLPADAALAAVQRGLADGGWNVRVAAAESAGALGLAAAATAQRLGVLSEDPVSPVAAAARSAMRRVVPTVLPPLPAMVAGRIAELRSILGEGWVVETDGKGLIVASSPEDEERRSHALQAMAGIRERLPWLGPADGAFSRPVMLLLVRGERELAAGIPGVTASGGNGYDPRSCVGLADAHAGSGQVTWVLLSAWQHQAIGLDERGPLAEGLSAPTWLYFGLLDADIAIEVTSADGSRFPDLRHEQMLAWMQRTGHHKGEVAASVLASVPADAPPPRLRWLLSLSYDEYERSRATPEQFSECFGRELVRYLVAHRQLEPFHRELTAQLSEHRARLVRAWDTPRASIAALEAVVGMPIEELEPRLFAWIAAGAPMEPAQAAPEKPAGDAEF